MYSLASVVHGIVTAHSRRITVDSALDTVTTFYIYLPAADSQPHLEAAKPTQDATAISTARIMVVDDETSILRITRAMLERQGCDVLALQCGMEAIRQFNDEPHRWDMVITDMINTPSERPRCR